MAKKVKVDPEMCIGCGLCVGSHPEIFDFDAEGKAAAIAEGDDAAVEDAVASCPVSAISEE